MTSTEFVRINNSEKHYSKKQLLNSELELLNLIKSFRTYRELRKEEFVLKVTLKNKIGEALDNLKELEKKLPKTDYKLHKQKKTAAEKKEEVKEKVEQKKKKRTLEDEINDVRKKLEGLKASM